MSINIVVIIECNSIEDISHKLLSVRFLNCNFIIHPTVYYYIFPFIIFAYDYIMSIFRIKHLNQNWPIFLLGESAA